MTFLAVAFCLLLALTSVSSFGINVQRSLITGTNQHRLAATALFSSSSADADDPPILCDLQTFLKLTGTVESGGEAKTLIQEGMIQLNGQPETRRAKKLFPGDYVSFFVEGEGETSLDVSREVAAKGYVFKPKKKKIKPTARVDADGNLEFGGKFRSEEWRKERKAKKLERRENKSN